jgi:hypothetical protein
VSFKNGKDKKNCQIVKEIKYENIESATQLNHKDYHLEVHKNVLFLENIAYNLSQSQFYRLRSTANSYGI